MQDKDNRSIGELVAGAFAGDGNVGAPGDPTGPGGDDAKSDADRQERWLSGRGRVIAYTGSLALIAAGK